MNNQKDLKFNRWLSTLSTIEMKKPSSDLLHKIENKIAEYHIQTKILNRLKVALVIAVFLIPLNIFLLTKKDHLVINKNNHDTTETQHFQVLSDYNFYTS